MRNNKFISDIFDFIKIVINFDNKLYKRAMKKQYNQFHEKVKNFFESIIKYH
jgi:phage-related minor tail protein